jgi:hypothetical protein
MRPCIEQSNGPVSLSPFQSWPDCIINTSGYDFRKGQVRDNDGAYGHVFTSRVKAMGIRDRPISPDRPGKADGFAFEA